MAFKSHEHIGKLGIDLITPNKHVTFFDPANPTYRLEALFNPQEITISKQAVYGKLNPIGSSNSHKQYAHTDSEPFSIDLWYSALQYRAKKRGLGYAKFEDPQGFFESFLHGGEFGRAPRRILVQWPNSVKMICRVLTVSSTLSRFNRKLHTVEYTMSIQLEEDTSTFYSSGHIRKRGLLRPDPRLFGEAPGSKSKTGKPMVIYKLLD